MTNFTELGTVATIILISLSLSGDNALVIGMAVHSVPDHHRKWALVVSVGAAIVFRVIFAGLFAFILFRSALPGIRLIGGVVLLWVAWTLLDDPKVDPSAASTSSVALRSAIVTVLLADASMSVDNMLAIASASGGDLGMILLGLLVSIPLLFVSASAIAQFIQWYPQLLWAGAAVIIWVGSGLIADEPLLAAALPNEHTRIVLGGLFIIGFVTVSSVRDQ